MFSSSKSSHSTGVTLIARNTQIKGTVQFSGTLNIEGFIQGDVDAAAESKSEVAVLEHGKVEGEIRAPRVIVNGRVKGDIHSSDQLYIASKAIIEGSVHYRLIEMEKGAQISGSILHVAANKTESKPVNTAIDPVPASS